MTITNNLEFIVLETDFWNLLPWINGPCWHVGLSRMITYIWTEIIINVMALLYPFMSSFSNDVEMDVISFVLTKAFIQLGLTQKKNEELFCRNEKKWNKKTKKALLRETSQWSTRHNYEDKWIKDEIFHCLFPSNFVFFITTVVSTAFDMNEINIWQQISSQTLAASTCKLQLWIMQRIRCIFNTFSLNNVS